MTPLDAPDISTFQLVDGHTDLIKYCICIYIHLTIENCYVQWPGLDCVGVRHFGPTVDTESYIQRCGRNGYHCQANRSVQARCFVS